MYVHSCAVGGLVFPQSPEWLFREMLFLIGLPQLAVRLFREILYLFGLLRLAGLAFYEMRLFFGLPQLAVWGGTPKERGG
ncbi:MAG: hypothetical protein NC078_09030, partial [Ruminococcus sp.]|nr:hypothetical protein [Ruminococcus sp.]